MRVFTVVEQGDSAMPLGVLAQEDSDKIIQSKPNNAVVKKHR